MSDHTPGPWTVHPLLRPDLDDDPMGHYVVEEARDKLTPLYFETEPDDGPEGEAALAAIHSENAANARLIAAAPAMLATLEDVELRATQARMASTIGKKSGQEQANFLRGELERIALVARAAIEKATGGDNV